MSVPRYKPCKENTKYFLEYLKVANKYKNNKFCDKIEYELLKDIYPLKGDLKTQFQKYLNEEYTVVDITGSSDEEVIERIINDTNIEAGGIQNVDEVINQSAVEDITHAIKESLDTQKCLSDETLLNLQYSTNLEDVFQSLAKELNFEAVINFGNSLTIVSVNDSVVAFYIKHLLLNKVNNEFSEDLELIMNNFSQQYVEVLNDELTKYFLHSNISTSKVFSRFLQGLNPNFQIKLLKNILCGCEIIQINHLNLIDILISDHMDFDTLTKLVELLSISSNKHQFEKAFGRLVINVVKIVGKNIHLLEQPLRHIISTHKTIWKPKIQKIVEENLEDSMMSQTLR